MGVWLEGGVNRSRTCSCCCLVGLEQADETVDADELGDAGETGEVGLEYVVPRRVTDGGVIVAIVDAMDPLVRTPKDEAGEVGREERRTTLGGGRVDGCWRTVGECDGGGVEKMFCEAYIEDSVTTTRGGVDIARVCVWR